jgi:simple sugar transport system permease protein
MLATIIQRAVMQGTPLLFGSTGEILTEKSGHLNLGIPGIMYVGAISGVAGSFIYEQSLTSPASANPFLTILIPLLCCILGSALMGFLYCFLTVTLRANQNVTGLALTTFGIGVGNFFGGSLIKLVDTDVPSISLSTTSMMFKTQLPFAEKLGWFGDIFLSYGFLVYVAVVIAFVSSHILNKTRVGLHLRAVGESPETSDAAGINVTKYKYLATCIGSAIAGLGGLYYVMDYANGVWSNNGFGDRGWLSIALVIFSVWRPSISILGSILFGFLYVIPTYIPNITVSIKKLFEMLPYVVTILVLIITSIKDKKENQPPAALGLAYFREER